MAVSVQDLTKRFGGLTAVNDVSFDVRTGEIVGLVGPNGAGKSVLLSCIAGALRPDEGRVFLGEVETTAMAPERVCRLGLARTFQVPQPFAGMTVYDSALVAATFGAPGDDPLTPDERAREALELIGFDAPPDTPVATLNTIELKQLDLARALASKPRTLLLDELGAGLMTGQLGDLIETVRRISRLGVTIIMVEHVIDAIVSLCPRLVVLDHGEVLADGETGTVMRRPEVVEAYLGEGAAQ